MITLLLQLLRLLPFLCGGHRQLALENLALLTEHPTAAWTAQQIVDAFPDDTPRPTSSAIATQSTATRSANA